MHVLSCAQLRACLGMQIVACGATLFNIISSMAKYEIMPSYCWYSSYENFTLHYETTCRNIQVS